MKNNRRNFLKLTGTAGIAILGKGMLDFIADSVPFTSGFYFDEMMVEGDELSIIGNYGSWAAGLIDRNLPSLSYRRKEWNSMAKWESACSARGQSVRMFSWLKI